MERCPICDTEQGLKVELFSWKEARLRSNPEGTRRANRIHFKRTLRFGSLYQCSLCAQIWYLDDDEVLMHRIDRESVQDLHDWSDSKLDFTREQISTIKKIKAIAADHYRAKSYLHLPCCVTTRSGERFEKAILLITKMPPIKYWMGPVFLGSSVLRIEASVYALSHKVRLQATKADEEKSGRRPTLVASRDGRFFHLNGSESFFDHEDLQGPDIELPRRSALNNIKSPLNAKTVMENRLLIPAFYYHWFPRCESRLG